MRLLVNGQPYDHTGAPTLAALLAALEIDPLRVATLVNDEAVRRDERDRAVLRDNDRVEALAFACGG
jgi:thiamine biosynthesis protein ThiS